MTSRRAATMRSVVAFALLIVPLVSTSTMTRAFEPPKSLALSVYCALAGAVFLLHARASPNGARAQEKGLPCSSGLGRTGLALACVLAALLALSTVFASDRWTAVLGGFIRRQGLVTHLSELFVLVAAIAAAASGAVRVPTAATFATIAAAGVSAAAIAQHRHVGLDPIEWSGETFNRVAGPIGSASQLSTYLAAVMPWTVMLALDAASSRARLAAVAAGLTLCLEVVALVLARGRSGWVGALAGLGALACTLPVTGLAARRLRAGLRAFAFAAVALVIALNLPGRPLHALTTTDHPLRGLFERLASVSEFSEGTGRIRVLAGDMTTSAFAAKPSAWAVGFGPDGEWDALAPFDTRERAALEKDAAAFDRPHALVAEKLMEAGLGAAIAFLALVGLGLGAALERLGAVRSARRFAVVAVACAAIAALATWMATGRFALAPAAASLGAAAAAVGAFVVAALRRRDAVPPAGAGWWAASAAALIAHLVAGSVGVTTPPERVLVLAIVGVCLGWKDDARASEPSAIEWGAWIGAACAVTLPAYAALRFGWAAGGIAAAEMLVPLAIVLVALPFSSTSVSTRLVAACVVFGAAWVALAACVSASHSAPGGLATPEPTAMGWCLPAILGVACAAALVPAWFGGDRGAPAAPAFSWPRLSGALALLAIAAALAWIGASELRSDSAKFAAVKLGNFGRPDLATRYFADARRIGNPLAALGGVSVVDRVIPSERTP